jgi:Recombinase zinc beta ribbon domain
MMTKWYRVGSKRVKEYRPKHEQIKLAVPALIDEETWNQVQAQIAYNKRTSPRNARYPESALLRSGIAVCGYCGGNMVAVTDADASRTLYYCQRARDKAGGCPGSPTITASIIDTDI